MSRWLLALGVVLSASVPEAQAVILMSLDNPFDAWKALDEVRQDKRVRAFDKTLDEFTEYLCVLKERDFHALFGKPEAKKREDYALSIAGPSGIMLSGLRHADPRKNKDHIDFHRLGDHGGVEVYYQIDGETPAVVVLYFRVERDFPPLKSAKGLENRLCWEQQHFRRLVRYWEARRRLVFEWEVDEEAESKLYQDEETPDLKAKLAAWTKAGAQRGYRLVGEPLTEDSRPEWKWYGPGNRLLWQARHDRGFSGVKALPSEFIRFHPNGKPARKEEGWPEIYRIWWYRQDGTTLRCEDGSRQHGRWRPIDWTWYDKSGKGLRCEKDSNGDGIPDLVNEKPLAVKDSWAIRPRLIPKEYTNAELHGRRVPIRKIPE